MAADEPAPEVRQPGLQLRPRPGHVRGRQRVAPHRRDLALDPPVPLERLAAAAGPLHVGAHAPRDGGPRLAGRGGHQVRFDVEADRELGHRWDSFVPAGR